MELAEETPPDQVDQHELLTIGQFAAATRLSHRALRIYDSIGLLSPVQVDERTGYRRYAVGQIPLARRVQLLRGIGMSLADIKQLPTDQPAAADAMRAFWQHAEAQHTARRELFRRIQATQTGDPSMMYDVSTREVPAQKVLSQIRRVTVNDLSPSIGAAIGGMLEHLQAAGVASAPSPYVVYHGHVDEDSDGPVEVCVPFEGTVEPAGDMAVRLEPAHQAAYTRLTKGQMQFPSVLSAYDAVQSWIDDQPTLERFLPPREVYFADWPSASDEDEVCDITWPIRASTG